MLFKLFSSHEGLQRSGERRAPGRKKTVRKGTQFCICCYFKKNDFLIDKIYERKYILQAKLLFAKYNDETLNVNTDVNIANYKEAILVWGAWEKSLLACAQYYESIVDRMSEDERDTKGRLVEQMYLKKNGREKYF